jgi:hypothetical protein
VDGVGNVTSTVTSLSIVATGTDYANLISLIAQVPANVWAALRASNQVANSFGEALQGVITPVRANNLDNLDVTVSTRATQTSVNTINTKIGTPVSSISADIAAVKADTASIDTKVDVTLSTRATQTSVDAINTKIGTPVSSVSADIAAVKAVSDNIDTKVDVTLSTRASQTSVNTINTKIGTPVADVSADIAAVKAVSDLVKLDTTSIDTKVDVTVSTRATQTSVNAIPTNPLLTTDTRLNNLDATISSRASASQVASIQNNTDFVGIVPAPMILPETGTKDYPIYVRLFNESNQPVDADLSEIYVTIRDSAGTPVVATTLMTNDAVGQYSFTYTVNSTDTERNLYVFFDYDKAGNSFNQVRSTEVTEFESKLDTLLSRLTPTRANNLDNLDATVSTRATQTSVNTINTKIGTPVADVSADIAAVKADTASIDTKVDVTVSTRATQTSVNTINTKIGTPVADVSADIAAVKADTASIDTKVDVTLSTRATQTSVDAVPTAQENATAVWEEDVNDHLNGTSTGRTLKDAKIFSQIDL